MKPLSIRNALKLYSMLSPYIPETKDKEFDLEFVNVILENIKTSDRPKDYLDAVSLMNGIPSEVIIERATSEEILHMFIQGIIDNKLLLLQEFCKKVGWNG